MEIEPKGVAPPSSPVQPLANDRLCGWGVEDIATVKRMYLETDGEMSVIRNDEPGSAA